MAGSQAYALQTPGGVVPCNGLLSLGCSERDSGASLNIAVSSQHPRSMNLQIGPRECTGRKGILCRAVQASWKHTFAALWRYAWGNAGGILEKSFLADMSLRWWEMIWIDLKRYLSCHIVPNTSLQRYMRLRCTLASEISQWRVAERRVCDFLVQFSVQLPRPVQASSLAAGGPFAATEKDACHRVWD